MKKSIKLVALLLTAGFYSACTQQLPPDTRSRISLEGNWGLQLDTAGTGIAPGWLAKPCTDSLFLPGTTDMGKKGTYNTDMTQTTGGMGRDIRPPGDGTYETHDNLDRRERGRI